MLFFYFLDQNARQHGASQGIALIMAATLAPPLVEPSVICTTPINERPLLQRVEATLTMPHAMLVGSYVTTPPLRPPHPEKGRLTTRTSVVGELRGATLATLPYIVLATRLTHPVMRLSFAGKPAMLALCVETLAVFHQDPHLWTTPPLTQLPEGGLTLIIRKIAVVNPADRADPTGNGPG